MLLDPSEMRQDYDRDQLVEDMVDADPIRQFAMWFEDARNGGLMEPNAMSLSTVTEDGGVSSRMVLMKGFDERGFTRPPGARARRRRPRGAAVLVGQAASPGAYRGRGDAGR